MESSSESEGKSPRLGKNQSLDEWYQRKEEKRSQSGKQGLNRKSGLRKVRINPVSKKQKQKNKEYAQARKEHYSNEENQRCFLCGRTDGLSVHHIAKRLSGNHSDTKTFLTLCIIGDALARQHPELNYSSLGCHGMVHANPNWSRENNLLE